MKVTSGGRLFTAPMLWTHAQVEMATGGTAIGHWNASGVAVELEGLMPGNLFIALEEGDSDTHDQVAEALERGAAAAVVHKMPDNLPDDACLLLVPDTFAALKDLSKIGRYSAPKMKVIAITGAVGKSGVKNILGTLLRGMKKQVLSVKDNDKTEYQNHHGIPCSLSNASDRTDFGLFDIGLQRIGEVASLSREILPSIAIITNIDMAGLHGFASLDDMAVEASRLFDSMAWGSTAILNRDDRYYDLFVAAARTRGITEILSFGKHESADARLISVRMSGARTELVAELDNRRHTIRVPAIGKHWAYHALAALLMVRKAGLDVAEAVTLFEDMAPLQHRGNTHFIYPAHAVEEPISVIDETGHASLASLGATLDHIYRQKPLGHGRKIAIFGEVQDIRHTHHEILDDIVDDLKQGGVREIISFGQSPFFAHSSKHFDLPEELSVHLLKTVQPGDIILMKGHGTKGLRKAIKSLYSLEQSGTSKANITPFPSLVERMDAVEFRSRKTANDR